MYEGTSSQLRSKYLGGSLSASSNRLYQGSNDIDYQVDNLELESIYKKKAVRLELELAELRKENEQLKQSNQQLKSSEALRNARNQSFEQEKQLQLQRERDDIMRDVVDLARGNRLLSQENDILSQKYSNLLDVYNKVILNNTSASKLAEVYSNQIEGRTRILKDYTKEKWEEFSELNSNYESNKRKINEMYATLKGKLMHLQTDSHINYDTKEQWRAYAEDVQEVFDSVFRLSQEQSDLHQKLVINMQNKNRELQQKFEENNGLYAQSKIQTPQQNELNSKEYSRVAQEIMQNSNYQINNNLPSIQESKNEQKSTEQNTFDIPSKDQNEQNPLKSKKTKLSQKSDLQPRTIRSPSRSEVTKSSQKSKQKIEDSKTLPKQNPGSQQSISPGGLQGIKSKQKLVQKLGTKATDKPKLNGKSPTK
ncbi:hypothetical protein TTHERM_00703510 (macronuclear) [Tetrahymena thermophila SB210]|uniref:Uncharacterized protein n=1 Tax=Tetrahymena thermophila (strain SB210) TaxID=312017 RepID=Q22GH2_TETTS|nr:hypothetical protein TTHERM_00703510 [Tetrahymena thermophila SB210]EAR84359.3 hypothetical protein TTHERM_00703510 [Tetrahymena thermophila SB210]|eukprot:XP_001032022.3 hypothetical protein TTHERM_00703510 [Tetrahymena thermophila SB210]